MSDERPLLRLDVDGPLNPWKANQLPPGYEEAMIDGYAVRLNPAHGPMLLAAAQSFELMWCTTWNVSANTLIAPRIGLPELPVLHLDVSARDKAPAGVPRRQWFWKLDQIFGATGARPFALLDDEVSRFHRSAVRDRVTCLRFVDAGIGLKQTDVDFVLDGRQTYRPS